MCLFIINAICNYLFGWRDCQHASTVCIWSVYIYIHSHSKSRSRLFAGLFICLLATAIKRNYRAQITKQSAGKVHLLLPLYIYILYIPTILTRTLKVQSPKKPKSVAGSFGKAAKVVASIGVSRIFAFALP